MTGLLVFLAACAAAAVVIIYRFCRTWVDDDRADRRIGARDRDTAELFEAWNAELHHEYPGAGAVASARAAPAPVTLVPGAGFSFHPVTTAAWPGDAQTPRKADSPAPENVPGFYTHPPAGDDAPGPVSTASPAADGAPQSAVPAPGPGALITHGGTALQAGHPEPWFYAATYEEACRSRSGELNIHDDQWPWLAEGQYDRAAAGPPRDDRGRFTRRETV